MALIRHTARAARCVRTTPSTTAATRAAFSISARRQGGGGHGNESQWDAPGGWLWGVKPGEKAESEGWEWPMYAFCGGLVAAGVALMFKPDTSVSTWALEEARRRLEAEGVLPDSQKKQ